jgi:DNA-binding PadR family transcriptional regulator
MGDIRMSEQTAAILESFLADPSAWHYGFDVIRGTRLKSGTVYPVLARLEDARWVESAWETEMLDGRPRRRYYRLTGKGETAARVSLASWRGKRTPQGHGIGAHKWA